MSERWIKIKALAKELRIIRDRMSDGRSEQFLSHCDKILESNDKNLIDHWAGDLWDLCSWIMRIKTKSDFKIDKQFIKENFFWMADDLELFVPGLRNIRDNEGRPLEDGTEQAKFNAYWNFADKVSEELADKTLTQNKLKSLVNQYLVNIK